jgi:hypothetical protein
MDAPLGFSRADGYGHPSQTGLTMGWEVAAPAIGEKKFVREKRDLQKRSWERGLCEGNGFSLVRSAS